MKSKLAAAALAVLLTMGLASRSEAGSITYVLPDVGTFGGYTDSNSTDTFTGTGFVGEYGVNANGTDAFAHLFGLEGPDYSRTDLQVGIGALSGATINSATLSFVLLDGGPGTGTLTATSYNSGGTLVFNYDNTLAALGTASGPVNGLTSNSLDVTSLVQSAVTASQSYFALHLQTDIPGLYTYTYAGFSDSADRADVRLTVVYGTVATPEPATLASAALAVLAGAGTVIARRRRAVVA